MPCTGVSEEKSTPQLLLSERTIFQQILGSSEVGREVHPGSAVGKHFRRDDTSGRRDLWGAWGSTDPWKEPETACASGDEGELGLHGWPRDMVMLTWGRGELAGACARDIYLSYRGGT